MVAGPGEGLHCKLHRATAHQPGNERRTSSQRLGMSTRRATLTGGNRWCGDDGQRQSRGGSWLGPTQQGVHQEHAITLEGRQAPAECWLAEEGGWSPVR
jgi:hypothetical protein